MRLAFVLQVRHDCTREMKDCKNTSLFNVESIVLCEPELCSFEDVFL